MNNDTQSYTKVDVQRIRDNCDKKIGKEHCVKWLDKKKQAVIRRRARFQINKQRLCIAKILYENEFGSIGQQQLFFECGKYCINPHHAKLKIK